MPRSIKRDPAKAVPAPAAYVRLLLRRFATTPELKAKLLAGTELDERGLAQLVAPAAEVSLFNIVKLSENLTQVIGETWALDAISAWSTAAQGALDVAVRSAATVGDGIEIMRRFGHVRGPFLNITIRRSKHNTTLALGSNVAMDAGTLKAMSETAIISARSMIETVAGESMDQLEYQFPWRKPVYAERMRAALGGTLVFEQPQCAIVLPNALCESPSPFADRSLHDNAVSELEGAAGRIGGRDMLPLKVERLLQRKRKGRLSEDEAAQQLGISRRTLVRRLGESGTNFRELLDANLRERALALIEAKQMSRADMAEALGFDDPTSFSRACRRWFKKD